MALQRAHSNPQTARAWTVVLKDNVFWSDGKKLVAEDFVYAWKRAASEAMASPYAYLITDNLDLTKTVAKDSKTIVVALKLKVPYMKSLFAFPTFMPVRKDIVENADGTPNDKWTLDPKKFVIERHVQALQEGTGLRNRDGSERLLSQQVGREGP